MIAQPICLVVNPYHRGGITRWMPDMAAEWSRAHGPVWAVTVRPRRPFISARTGREVALPLRTFTHESRGA